MTESLSRNDDPKDIYEVRTPGWVFVIKGDSRSSQEGRQILDQYNGEFGFNNTAKRGVTTKSRGTPVEETNVPEYVKNYINTLKIGGVDLSTVQKKYFKHTVQSVGAEDAA